MNEFVLEKFKVEYDSEGNEILKEKTGEYRKKNFISLRVKDRFALGSSSTCHKLSGTFLNEYLIGVCTQKSYSKLAGYHSSVAYITSDATYVGDDRIIIGSRLEGKDKSDMIEGDITVHSMKCRFTPPASGTREINSVFMGNLKVEAGWAGSNAALSNILLDAPCFQESDEVLIITYRYTYNYKQTLDSIPFKDNSPELAAHNSHMLNLFDSSSTNCYVSTPNRIAVNSNSAVSAGKDLFQNRSSTHSPVLSTYLNMDSINNAEGYFKFNTTLDVNTLNGILVNSFTFYGTRSVSIGTGYVYYPSLAEVKFRGDTETCIQNVYVKVKSNSDINAAAPTPFYDLDNLGESLGSLTLSEDFSSGNTSYQYKTGLMELGRIEVTQEGATGTSKYKLSTKYLTSTLTGSTWQSQQSNPIIGDTTESLNFHYTNDLNKAPSAINYALTYMIRTGTIMGLQAGELLVFNPSTVTENDGIWVYSYDSGDTNYPFKLDSSTVTGFNAVDIRGVTTAEDGTIFVACAVTGLWKLLRNCGDAPASTVVQRITNTGASTDTSCHGVNFCRANGRFNSDAKIYALFNDELCVSADGGQNWSIFTSATGTPFNFTGDPDKVVGICPNYHDTEREVAIVMTRDDFPTKYGTSAPNASSFFVEVFFWNEEVSQTNGISEHATVSLTQYYREELGTYGGSNNLLMGYMPDVDLPNHKWVYHTCSSTSGSRISVGTSLNAATKVLSSNYILTMSLIDDLVSNETHLVAGMGNDGIRGCRHSMLKNLNSFTYSNEFLSTGVINQRLVYIGRNMFLWAGRSSQGLHPKQADIIGDYSASFISFFDPRYPERDYYEGNPLNLWFNWVYDGSAWKIDGTGSVDKLTHTNSNTLARGLSVSFADSPDFVSSPINFKSGEFFDVYLADGVVKDSYTEIDLNGMFFFGTSKEGNDFFPSIVPANPTTNATIPLAVEYNDDSYTGRVTGIAFEVDYVGQSGIGGYGDNAPTVPQNFALLGAKLSNDFSITFKLGTSLNDIIIDNINTTTKKPHFGFVNNDLNVDTSSSPFVYGINLKSGATHNDKILFIFHEGNYTEIAITDYQPQTDEWKFTRTGQNITCYRNNVPLHTVLVSVSNLRTMYSTQGNSSNPLSIFNAKLTFDDYRLTSRIGNPTAATGAWDANFGKMHIQEYIEGIKKIFLDGTEASIIYDVETSTPSAGEVRICRGTGELIFSPDDAGKVITGDWRMIPCVNVREV